jgi:hypothetical protein
VANWCKVHGKPIVCALLQVKIGLRHSSPAFLTVIIIVVVTLWYYFASRGKIVFLKRNVAEFPV